MASLFMTGGSGFIGQNFLRDYADKFSRIILPLRSLPKFDLHDHVQVIMVEGKAKEIARLLEENPCDFVLNTAAYGVAPTARDVNQMLAINVDLPVELAKAAQKVGAKQFVQLGTMSEYLANGSGETTRETDKMVTDETSYGGSKAEATRQLEKLAKTSKTCIICLRLFGVFGAGEASHRLLSALQSKLSAGEVVPMSKGAQVRDFIYVPDVTAAIYAALRRSGKSEFAVYNIGSGHGISVREFAELFCKLGNYLSDQIDFGALPMRDTDVAFMVANIDTAKVSLDWSPQWTTEAALADYLSALP